MNPFVVRNMRSFELEIWPNPKKTRTIFFSVALITMLAWACFAAAYVCWTPEYVYYVKETGTLGGWPVKLYWWALLTGITGVVVLALVYFMQGQKNPMLALNPSGLFIYQPLARQKLVLWSNIRSITKTRHQGWTSIEIDMADARPLKYDNRFTLGDLDGFVEKAKTYIDIKK